MKAIAATEKNWGIGKDNDLLVHLPGDLKFFREQTLGKVIIMGRKTLESLPGGKALPGRTTLVMTSDKEYRAEAKEGGRVIVCNGFDAVMGTCLMLEACEGIDIENDIYVCGGESIYKIFTPYCSEFIITRMDKEIEADKYFENLDELVSDGMLRIANESEPVTENGITYRWITYVRG